MILEKRVTHGREVTGFMEIAGQHRSYCLCWQGCEKFTPDNRETNCPIASELFAICVDNGVTTPVVECAEFTRGN